MEKNLFWKRVAADVLIIGAVLCVCWFVYSYYQKTTELAAYKKQEIEEQTKQDSIAKAKELAMDSVVTRIQQFVKASAEKRPSYLSRSTANLAARWWKARYNAGYETNESDMPFYYWFKSCKEANVTEIDSKHAEVETIINVNSPWDKRREDFTFLMVKENGKWQIHNIIGEDGELREKYR